MSRVAYAGYIYPTSGDPAGLAGIADFNGSAISHFGTDKTNVTSDTKVFWFKNADNDNRVLIAETQYDSNYDPLPSKFTVVDGANLNSVKGVNGVNWGSLVNVYALIRQGDYLVGIDYDECTVFRVLNSTGDTYSYQTGVFTLNLANADLNPAIATPYPSQQFGVDVSTDGTNIFALFIKGDDVYGGDYDPSLLVKLNLDLTLPTGTGVVNNTGAALAENAFSAQKYGSDLYVVSVGGMQNYGSTNGAASKIQKVAKSTMVTNDLLVGGATNDQTLGDFRALSFRDDGSEAFILTGALNTDGETFTGALYRTTMSALAGAGGGVITSISGIVSTNITTIPGYLWSLLYSQEEDMTWMARGNDLAVYKYNPPVPVPPTPASVAVVDAKSINTLSSVSGYSLNAVTLYNNIKVQTLRGAAQPAMASNSARALIERKKLLANTKK